MKLVQVMAIKTFSFYCRSVHVQEEIFNRRKDKIYKSSKKNPIDDVTVKSDSIGPMNACLKLVMVLTTNQRPGLSG